MNDYAQTLSSTGQTGFYPVTAGIDCAGAEALLRGDITPGTKVIPALPDPGEGFEWYLKDCSGVSSDVVTDWQSI